MGKRLRFQGLSVVFGAVVTAMASGAGAVDPPTAHDAGVYTVRLQDLCRHVAELCTHICYGPGTEGSARPACVQRCDRDAATCLGSTSNASASPRGPQRE